MYIRSVIRSRRIKKPQSFSDDHTRQPSKVVRFGVQERVDLIIDLILEMTAIKAVIGYQGADNRPNRLPSFELFHADLGKPFSPYLDAGYRSRSYHCPCLENTGKSSRKSE
jgi:hypothetical protein